jgi:Ca2+-binding RTX toxin-like protein
MKGIQRLKMLAAALVAAGATASGALAGPPPTLDVSPQGTGSGTVSGKAFNGTTIIGCVWNGTNRSGDCSETFAVATLVQLTATSAAGSNFGGWNGCPGTLSGADGEVCTFTADPSTPVTLKPEFDPDVGATVTIGPQGAGSGTVTGKIGAATVVNCSWDGTATSGDCAQSVTSFPATLVLEASATGGGSFGGWTNCPGTVSGTGGTICTFTVDDPSDDVQLKPSFLGADTQATLTVVPQGTGSGTVTGKGPGAQTVISCSWNGTATSGDCGETVAPGQGGTFTLQAVADTGSSLTSWTNCPGTVSADGLTCTFAVDDPSDDFTIHPVFTAGGGGGGGGGNGCTITGTDDPDVLTGTSDRDVICGLGGNDTIRGLDGNDVIMGGAGNDRIWGGGGTDGLYGGAGDDQIFAGAGTDNVNGGTGNDRLYGDAGSDALSGGAGEDRLFGGGGGDDLAGGGGGDWLYGGNGADVLNGGTGGDHAFGGGGHDICSAEHRASC